MTVEAVADLGGMLLLNSFALGGAFLGATTDRSGAFGGGTTTFVTESAGATVARDSAG